MTNSMGIFKIYKDSFRANKYSRHPFRMIGLIDVDIIFLDSIERMTLAYFRSSGTNSGKIKGLWYPIVGIKTVDGKFTEFTHFINYVLTNTTRHGTSKKGWLAKSLFFSHNNLDKSLVRGFSDGIHYSSLLWIGETLRTLYENKEYKEDKSLDAKKLNALLVSDEAFDKNKHSQKENFEMFVEDVYDVQDIY